MINPRTFACNACVVLLAGAAIAVPPSAAQKLDVQSVRIPVESPGKPRPITIDDISAIRTIESLRVSPDGQAFVIVVRQGDAQRNVVNQAIFRGGVNGQQLQYIDDGGSLDLSVSASGHSDGRLTINEVRWSPDGNQLAYLKRFNGETQIWLSKPGELPRQVTRETADILKLEWSDDSSSIRYWVGSSREKLADAARVRELSGYSYDRDLFAFTDLMRASLRVPPETELVEHLISIGGPPRFRELNIRSDGRPIINDRSEVGAEPISANSEISRIWLSAADGTRKSYCPLDECRGAIKAVWWSKQLKAVIFWKGEGTNDSANAFYSWRPERRRVLSLYRSQDEFLSSCDLSGPYAAICIREAPNTPPEVTKIEFGGRAHPIGVVNPEFKNIRLGRIERIEWDTPKLNWNEPGGKLEGFYPKRAYGYILYPPDYDPKKKYPVFVHPYGSNDFRTTFLSENPLHVYAAQGFVAVNLAFPMFKDGLARFGSKLNATLYDRSLNFPHLSMLAGSTFNGIHAAEGRANIDTSRIGIGGVSHGTFVPLFMMMQRDEIAAASISSPTWGPHEYYWVTQRGLDASRMAYGPGGNDDWTPNPDTDTGNEFWKALSVEDHVDKIRAPILMNLAASETYALIRLIRNLRDAGKPYDAYVYSKEAHIKWQPAHLASIYRRNLDWFQFWLRDQEDPSPSKAEQYVIWRRLREAQCDEDQNQRDRCAR